MDIPIGALVRFVKPAIRLARGSSATGFQTLGREVTVPAGTIAIVIGAVEGQWQGMRPIVFTSLGSRVCEMPTNLEILSSTQEDPCHS